jgi:hypothetical protein
LDCAGAPALSDALWQKKHLPQSGAAAPKSKSSAQFGDPTTIKTDPPLHVVGFTSALSTIIFQRS